MRLVLGVSLTASSAVWVLVDTVTGNPLAEEVVAVDSPHELARKAALSVQTFDAHTEHDIEGVRLTWCDDADQQGIRLRTKLRLFGFETVETVSQEAAREGRNKTARYLAPHLVLAYGAARFDRNADKSSSVLPRLAVRVPMRVAAASGAAAAAVLVVGVALYALGSPSPPEAPDIAAAEPAPALHEQQVMSVPSAAPPTLPVPPAAARPAEVPAPSQTPETVTRWSPTITVNEPESVSVGPSTTGVELDSTVPVSLPAAVGVPHLATALGEAAAPALPGIPTRHAAIPTQPGIPAQPAAVHAPPGIPTQHAAIPTQPGIPTQPAAVHAPPGIPAQHAAIPTQPGIPTQPAAIHAPPGIPAQHAAIPTQLGIPAQPAAIPNQPGIPAQPAAMPAPLPPVLSSFFEALP